MSVHNVVDPTCLAFAPVAGEQTIQGCKNPRMFANSGTLRTDKCTLELRTATNDAYAQYSTWNPRDAECTTRDDLAQFASCHENLRYKQGHGNVDPCFVDDDSRLRQGAFTDADRRRYQLFPREFKANPGLANGDFMPEIDSRLTRGAHQQRDKRSDVAGRKQCDHLSESEINNNFIPLIPCLAKTIQDPDHIVPKWTNGGMPSRIMVRKICNYQSSQPQQ